MRTLHMRHYLAAIVICLLMAGAALALFGCAEPEQPPGAVEGTADMPDSASPWMWVADSQPRAPDWMVLALFADADRVYITAGTPGYTEGQWIDAGETLTVGLAAGGGRSCVVVVEW